MRDELVRILTEGGARRGFELLDASGMLAEILPEVAAMKGVEQPPEYHPEGDVWMHTLMLLEQLDHPTPTLALGALLHDVGKPPTFRVAGPHPLRRARGRGRRDGPRDSEPPAILARRSTEQVEALVANHMKFKDVAKMKAEHAEAFSAHAGVSRSTWSCTGWMCCPAIGGWRATSW